MDNEKRKLTSVTVLVSKGFEEFDAEAVAKRKCAKEGGDWRELVALWEEKGRLAAKAGTRLHENCERHILGQMDLLNSPQDEVEKINFKLAYDAIEEMKRDRTVVKFEPEKRMYSDRLGLVGVIDLLVTHIDGSYTLYDWKNVKDLSQFGFRNKCGILPCTRNIQDSNYWHYALQLQIYEIMLKADKIIPVDAVVRRKLNAFINGRLQEVDMPDVKEAAKGLIIWNSKREK